MSKFKKYLLIIIALVGFLFAVFMIFYTSKKPKVAKIEFPPPQPPYKHFAAGQGIIEAASENIEIGTPFPEVVDIVYVEPNDFVEKNKPLYKLNTQTLQAKLQEAIAQKEIVLKELQDQRLQFSYYEKLKNKNAVSQSEYTQAYYNLEKAEKQLKEMEATIEVVNTNIYRSTILAPVNGVVLDINLRVGENAQTNPFTKNWLMLFGNLDVFHIRIDIDETDAWRIYKNAKATAYVRGNSSIKIPLQFVRIEPYVTEKKSLTGDNTQRVDTRVLQLIYKFNKDSYPVYVGQIMDVYVEALPLDEKF